jgi:hypothetical protein
MAVALGASCDFLTPIGHQNNTLVMGLAGNRFGDFWRLGLPLSIVVIVLGTPPHHVGLAVAIEHDPEKWVPVFGKRSCSNMRLEQDGDSATNHPALVWRI